MEISLLSNSGRVTVSWICWLIHNKKEKKNDRGCLLWHLCVCLYRPLSSVCDSKTKKLGQSWQLSLLNNELNQGRNGLKWSGRRKHRFSNEEKAVFLISKTMYGRLCCESHTAVLPALHLEWQVKFIQTETYTQILSSLQTLQTKNSISHVGTSALVTKL